MTDSTQKLRLGALIALVVGSMVGGGIFSLPQNIAASAILSLGAIGAAHECQTNSTRSRAPSER